MSDIDLPLPPADPIKRPAANARPGLTPHSPGPVGRGAQGRP